MRARLLRTFLGAVSLIVAGLSVAIIFAVSMSGLPGRPHYARGTVTGHEPELTGRTMESLRYFPIVGYIDAAGNRRSFRSWSGFVQPHYATGTIVRVVYVANQKPKLRRAEIVSPASRWAARAWLPWLITAVAFIFVIPCIVVACAFLNGRKIRDLVSTFRRAPTAA